MALVTNDTPVFRCIINADIVYIVVNMFMYIDVLLILDHRSYNRCVTYEDHRSYNRWVVHKIIKDV